MYFGVWPNGDIYHAKDIILLTSLVSQGGREHLQDTILDGIKRHTVSRKAVLNSDHVLLMSLLARTFSDDRESSKAAFNRSKSTA